MQPRLLDTLFIALIFHVQSTVWWYETTNAHKSLCFHTCRMYIKKICFYLLIKTVLPILQF